MLSCGTLRVNVLILSIYICLHELISVLKLKLPSATEIPSDFVALKGTLK